MKGKSAEAIVEELLITGILNGKYPEFSMLKPERELASEFGYSRPVIHKAIIRLESKGLVTIIPRQGIRVNDYRETGKLGLLESIYDLYHGGISKSLNQSMLNFINNNLEAMIELLIDGPYDNRRDCIQKQNQVKFEESLDVFIWLQNFALFCGNSVYPMLLNEFKSGILNVASAVFLHGDRSLFEAKLKAVTSLLSDDYEIDILNNKLENNNIDNKNTAQIREVVAQTIQTLFTFIEENWLLEGENHETKKSSC